jgi:hypothetical protein
VIVSRLDRLASTTRGLLNTLGRHRCSQRHVPVAA